MNKWELARYLIDAKKAVDSVWFIALNGEKLRNIDIRKEIEGHRSDFYINACAVLDEFTGCKKRKKEVCNADSVIESVYYERDKHYAHKDYDYRPKHYDSLLAIYEDMKAQIIHVREVCAESLPDAVTLDFVPHDKQLFRHLHGVTPEKEEEIKKVKHSGYGRAVPEGVETKEYQILLDSEDVKFLTPEEKKKYATLIECGICGNESLQNFQDASIRSNVLFQTDIWCRFKQEKTPDVEKLKKNGYLDEFDIPHIPNPSDPIAWNLFIKTMHEIGENHDKA